ncbi:SPOSA6832_04246 [Sporobolomyces salmonicolor]|uniref:SPOSA6832_04246-mRNA-1:cds n=1 Tax=Sporidiobolus salmonicolor TaxID=5005 RepID=A0A0D6ES79_SPOSA|nr:SPOSA6832_04246 [Sporobolomyces salmonicolor]
MITSLGTALLDEFEWLAPDGTPTRPREVRWGGGGTYAIIGARVWTTAVGQLVHRGPDFPAAIEPQLDRFGPVWHFRRTEEPTPRALNTYRPPSTSRSFRYVTRPPALSPTHLLSFASLSSPVFLHLCCPPSHLLDVVLPALRSFPAPPRICFEPIPYACVPDSLPLLRRAFDHVDVFSPNHDEAFAIVGGAALPEGADAGDVERAIENVAQVFRREGARALVLRSGAAGAYVLDEGADDGEWVRPYHVDASEVVDTLGAGNSFLGGLMAGLVVHPTNLALAAQYASVSSGIVIEQEGLPRLTVDADGAELWNGKSAAARLAELQHARGGR